MRLWMFVVLGAVACKKEPTSEPPPEEVDCEADEITQLLQDIPATDWPEGLTDAMDLYRSLDGRWTAEACGEPINVSIRTMDILDTTLEIVASPLPAGHDCGCTHDPLFPKDGELPIIARTTMDIYFQDYPEEGFREENAGNLASIPVAIYGPEAPFVLRTCPVVLVPPVLLLDYRETEVTFRVDASGTPSAVVTLTGPEVPDASCEVTGWRRVGDN